MKLHSSSGCRKRTSLPPRGSRRNRYPCCVPPPPPHPFPTLPQTPGPCYGCGVAVRSVTVTPSDLYPYGLVALAENRLKYFLILGSRTTSIVSVRCVRVTSVLFAVVRLSVLGSSCGVRPVCGSGHRCLFVSLHGVRLTTATFLPFPSHRAWCSVALDCSNGTVSATVSFVTVFEVSH
jgi:hypothetical protein